jgi:UDP-GlcNAc:undecaprenyl-phosphate/decaprenyl-phosphate GlcNAc-1-phosphate transferase
MFGVDQAIATLAHGVLAQMGGAPKVPPDVVERIKRLEADAAALKAAVTPVAGEGQSPLEIFHGYIGVLVAAFLVTLLMTPVMRRLAVKYGIIDRPSEARKVHRIPIAYLGGVAVFLGMVAGILFAATSGFHGLLDFHQSKKLDDSTWPGGVPISVVLGMTIITLVGLLDDVLKISPRVKIGGQLFAAAALAVEDVGVKVAAGIVTPLGKALGIPVLGTSAGGLESVGWMIHVGGMQVPIDLVYWTGTAIIAIFVIGACNASNLIDGLDGLLSGTTAICAGGLLLVALMLAATDDGPRDASRVILCLALLGACLGFLPHNFNPATIFLGDSGSLLMGYSTIVIVLSLGDTGKTHLVLAGLIIYAVPIIDTTLAIVRRKVSKKKISDADDQHLHHMLKRALGVKGAVLVLYGIAALFAVLGVALSEGRGRVTYALALVFAAFIGVTSFKIARREQIEKQAREADRPVELKKLGDGEAKKNSDAGSVNGTTSEKPLEKPKKD